MFDTFLTNVGRNFIAEFGAGLNEFTFEVWVGSGDTSAVPDKWALTDVLNPVAQARVTNPRVKDNNILFNVQYSNAFPENTGVGEFIITNFGVIVNHPRDGRIMLWGSFLKNPIQISQLLSPSDIASVEFPVQVSVTDDCNITWVPALPGFATEEELVNLIELSDMVLPNPNTRLHFRILSTNTNFDPTMLNNINFTI